MHSINQSKTKQLRGRKIPQHNDLKKSLTKFKHGLLPNHLHQNTKSPHHKLSSKKSSDSNQASTSRTKKPPHKNLNVQVEYYNQQYKEDANTGMFSQDYGGLQFKSANCSSKEKKSSVGKKSHDHDHDLMTKTTKFNLPETKGVINFEGKFVKSSAKQIERVNKNYTTFSHSDFSISEQEGAKRLKFRKKVKSKSKSKSKNKQISAGKNLKTLDKKDLRKTMGHQEQYLIRKTLMTEQTQVSPFRLEYVRNQLFDMCQIHFLVDQELNEQEEPICLNPNFQEIRFDCIRLISRLGGAIQIRRESFFLALHLFDRALDSNICIKNRNYKLLCMVVISLALKLEQAQLGIEFVCALGLINSKNTKDKVCHSRTKQSKSEPKSKSKSRKIGSHECERKVYLKKETKIKVDLIASILSEEKYPRNMHSEFLQLQLELSLRLHFRLCKCRTIYWADILSCYWDQFMLIERQSVDDCMLFRCPEAPKNLAYLYQILEAAHMSLRVQLHQPIYIILSIMYLLLRIGLEKDDNAFEIYRATLSKSTGILFVDKSGLNEMFWKFLMKLKVEMGDILACCQFVSEFLEPRKLDSDMLSGACEDFSQMASIHRYSSDLYNCIWK